MFRLAAQQNCETLERTDSFWVGMMFSKILWSRVLKARVTLMCRILPKVVLVTGLLCTPASPGAAQSVSGVVANQMGATVDAVMVTLRDASGEIRSETRSDSAGAFHLTIPRSGDYRIHAHAVGHQPTVSILFALKSDGLYQIDIEVQSAPAGALEAEVSDERYMEWVHSFVSDWRTRDIIVVAGQEWRDLVTGRDMVQALELADFPRVRLRRTPDGFCARTGSSTSCMPVSALGNGALPRIRDIRPEEVGGVVYIGPTIRSAPTRGAMGWQENAVNGRFVLFMRGYLAVSAR